MTAPVYHDEAVLMRWGESSTNGRTITLQITEDGDNPFKGLPTGKNGQRIALAAILINDDETPISPEQAAANGKQEFWQLKPSAQAYRLCMSPSYQEWILGYGEDRSEDKAKEKLCSHFGIVSRSELNDQYMKTAWQNHVDGFKLDTGWKPKDERVAA